MTLRPLRRARGITAFAGTLMAVTLTATLTGCVTNEESGNPEGWVESLPDPVPELQELLPQEYRTSGRIAASTNPTFPPNQFKDPHGDIIGFEVDLVRAAGAVLGLDVTFQQQDFNLILPSITGGTVDIGTSGFSDTEERQRSYDFVDFYNSGISWATTPGKTVDPDDACGLTVAVQKGTYSDTDDVQVKSDRCVADGQPAINKLVYESANAAANATALERADAMSSDSAVTDYAIRLSEGKLIPAGEAFDLLPFGWSFTKGSDLVPAFAAALEYLITSGQYEEILTPWGLTDGMVDTVTVNTQDVDLPDAATAPSRSAGPDTGEES